MRPPLNRIDRLITLTRRPHSATYRDNKLIYLEAVTPLSSLPPIVPAPMARPTPPPEIVSPLAHLHTRAGGLGHPLFESLVPHEVHLAIAVYEDRRAEFIKEEIRGRRDALDRLADTSVPPLCS